MPRNSGIEIVLGSNQGVRTPRPSELPYCSLLAAYWQPGREFVEGWSCGAVQTVMSAAAPRPRKRVGSGLRSSDYLLPQTVESTDVSTYVQDTRVTWWTNLFIRRHKVFLKNMLVAGFTRSRESTESITHQVISNRRLGDRHGKLHRSRGCLRRH